MFYVLSGDSSDSRSAGNEDISQGGRGGSASVEAMDIANCPQHNTPELDANLTDFNLINPNHHDLPDSAVALVEDNADSKN